MSDNTNQADSAVIRTLARQGGNVETQAFALDLGGGSNNPEILITAGQNLKALSVPVVLASDQGALLTTRTPGSNGWGASVAQTAGSTVALVTNTGVLAGYQLLGLVCSGTGEGLVAVKVNGSTVLSGRIRASQPTLSLFLPAGLPIVAGASVSLTVTNESGVTADFDGSLLGN